MFAKKIFYSLLSLVIAAVVVFVGLFFGYPDFNVWVKSKVGFAKTDIPDENEADGDIDGTEDGDDTEEGIDKKINKGFVVSTETGRNDIELLTVVIPETMFGEYGIMPLAQSAYNLTAVISPSDATFQDVTWSVKFKNAGSSWASGKTATDYVTVTPSSTNTLQATVQCLRAFSEQIVVTATSVDNPAVSADCVCDYVKRINNVNLSLSTSSSSFAATYTVNVAPEYSDGTLQGTIVHNSYKFMLSTAFYNTVRATTNGGDCGQMPLKMTVDYSAHTFCLGSSPYDTFYAPDGGGSIMSAAVVPMGPSLGGVTEAQFNQAFTKAVQSCGDYHAEVNVTFSYTYNGVSYGSPDAVAYVKFDANSLKVAVVGVTLNQSGLVF